VVSGLVPHLRTHRAELYSSLSKGFSAFLYASSPLISFCLCCVLQLQAHRAELYSSLSKGFRDFLGHGQEGRLARLMAADITPGFAAVSQQVRRHALVLVLACALHVSPGMAHGSCYYSRCGGSGEWGRSCVWLASICAACGAWLGSWQLTPPQALQLCHSGCVREGGGKRDGSRLCVASIYAACCAWIGSWQLTSHLASQLCHSRCGQGERLCCSCGCVVRLCMRLIRAFCCNGTGVPAVHCGIQMWQAQQMYAPSHDLPRLQLVVASAAPQCVVLSCASCCCAGNCNRVMPAVLSCCPA
jgi:hypothetical protein